MTHLIDTHAHIYHEDFAKDLVDMIRRCQESGVEKIMMPNVDHTTIDGMLELESRFGEMCKPMMGVHPCSVKQHFERELYEVEAWLSRRRFAAVGEIGIDLYWEQTFYAQQQEAFRIQVQWAKQYGLPVVIHCRESIEQTLELVEQLQDGALRGVFHCFSGNMAQAERITKLGFSLGIGGVATFKNGGLDKIIPGLELQHIVLETDSPYLAPVPHRGKRNEPAYVALVAQRVAELKNVALAEVQEVTTRNARILFSLDDEP